MSVAKIEAFWGRVRSTSSSGRSEAGKNCRGISGISITAPANIATVSASVSHFARSATVRKLRYQRTTRGGSVGWAVFGTFRMKTLSSGAKITATSQDTSSAMVTTANSVKQYSPAELAAKPIGTKPAIVTTVPVSMAAA